MSIKNDNKNISKIAEFGTTQRAYTMRLCPADKNDKNWKQDLWNTHERVNEAVRFFGDWLLTVRGGMTVPKDEIKPEQKRLLALCWFAVESEENQKHTVPHKNHGGEGGRKADANEMKVAFKECLKAKAIPATEHENWWKECEPSLMAKIKDDSIWVKRWKMYKEMQEKPNANEIADLMTKFLGKDYLKPAKGDEDGETATSSEGEYPTESKKTKDKKKKQKKAHDPSNQARQFCCDYFGKGKGTDFDNLRTRCLEVKELSSQIIKNIPADVISLRKKILEFREEKKWSTIKPIAKQGKSKPVKEAELNRGGELKTKWEKLLTAIEINKTDPNMNSSQVEEFTKPEYWKSLSELAEKTYKNKENKKGKPKLKPEWSKELLENLEKHVGVQYGDEPFPKNNHEFFYMIAGFGARRVSQMHSWIKIAEANRSKSEETKKEKENIFAKHSDWKEGRKWLEEYLAERVFNSNALGEMRIRKNAVDGWDEVVKKWNECDDADERKEAVRILQSEQEKFGDVNLFRDLAEDDAVSVWKPNGKKLLKSFVALQQAEYYVCHFKVPSFRHPDPVSHPVYCEFGNSKPTVEYAWKNNPDSKDLKKITEVDLYLLDKKLPLRWQSNRLKVDLGFELSARTKKALKNKNTDSNALEVSRADRLGLSAWEHNLIDKGYANYVFSDKIKEWNARLEIYRTDLEHIGKIYKENKMDKVKETIENLRWFITFSPQFPRFGPWWKYIENEEVRKKLFKDTKSLKLYAKENRLEDAPVSVVRFIDRKGSVTKCYTHVNDDYGWIVRPGLGILPKIRVMGVDLGHRYGAACTVWEQLSENELGKIAKEYGQKMPSSDSLSFTFEDTKAEIKSKNDRRSYLFFRRLGTDIWAKLVRQFVIKLPGEEMESRNVLGWEIEWLGNFYKTIGRKHNDDLWEKENVAMARIEALNDIRLALKRHGNLIKIYHAMKSNKRSTTGGGEKEVATEKERTEYIKSVMELWYQIASAKNWESGAVKNLWDKYILSIEPRLKLKSPDEEDNPKTAKKERNKLYDSVAEKLAKDEGLRNKIADEFLKLWQDRENQWKGILKGLGNMIAKGQKPLIGSNNKWVKQETKEQKHTGGLSLDRIVAMGLLAKIHNAYHQRPTDESLRNELKLNESPGKKFREKMERLRDDRIKKLTNAIVMSAMGLVGKCKNKVESIEQDRETGSRFNPVYAVCVENLENYKPEASRTRRENRALMSWSTGQLQKYLGETCDLYGIFLTEVSPSYTSRFCSRCGAPGIRGEIIDADKIKRESWQKQIRKSDKKEENKKTSRDKWLIELGNQKFDKDSKIPVPVQGGQIFFCSNFDCHVRGGLEKKNKKGKKYLSLGGIQADFNASANIALRAMTDGRWPGKWIYIPVNKEGKPNIEKAKNKKNALTNAPEELAKATLNVTKNTSDGTEKDGKKQKKEEKSSIHNVFRDITRDIKPNSSTWRYHKDFFGKVEEKVVENFKKVLVVK